LRGAGLAAGTGGTALRLGSEPDGGMDDDAIELH
jgi:hypothetical protein